MDQGTSLSTIDQQNVYFSNQLLIRRLFFIFILLFVFLYMVRASFAGDVNEPPISASLRVESVNLSGEERTNSAMLDERSSSFESVRSSTPNRPSHLTRNARATSDPLKNSSDGLHARETLKDIGASGNAESTILSSLDQAAWEQYAVATEASLDRPWIAIVIDDLGLNHQNALRAIDIEPPLTLAFMTYADGLEQMTALARSRGHELMLHVPMEPIDLARNYPGKNALMVDLPLSELRRRLDWGLSRFEGFVGVNNHMGSRFTQDPHLMALVADTLKRRGLLFLDSMTSGKSVGGHVASKAGIPVAFRDIFLDHEPTPTFVRHQLKQLERVAQRQGYAVAIGHPHAFTLSILEEWLPHAKAKGFSIVPLTSIIRRSKILG